MTQLSVATLRLRGPPALAARAAWRAEEALRLAAPEGDRLLVLRRLPLGRLSARGGGAAWQARADAALRDASSRAIHALSPGATGAEAVWFASTAEARRLLLQELASDRWPEAWFWPLAVPDWRGRTLDAWLPLLLAEAMRVPAEEAALARIVMRLADVQSLLPALARAAAPPAGDGPPWRHDAAVPRDAAEASEASRGLAARVMARLDDAPRRQVAAALHAAPQGEGARWLVRLALLAASPELAMQRTLLPALVEAVLAEPGLMGGAPLRGVGLPGEATSTLTAPHAPDSDSIAPERRAPVESYQSRLSTPALSYAAPASLSPPLALPAAASPAQLAAVDASVEWRSRAAGVLLLVRPLARMGLPAWLDRHPELAATGFARALLCHVAQRQRFEAEDALFLALGETAPQPPAALDAWRIGLDRWLRRRTRRRLADIVPRGGWLRLTEDSLVARFRADAADLHLRRLALDVDPGWVPWLGLAIRYHFRDAPQP